MARDDADFQAVGQKKTMGQKCNDFGRFIWNSDKKEFIGRTGSSWAKIGLFYLIFYACLAGFFAIMLAGFFSTLSEQSPTQTGMYSLIKNNPGMGFRPMANPESTLIQFKTGDKGSYEKHVKSIEDLLKTYKEQDSHPNVVDCDLVSTPLPQEGNDVCKFDLNATLGKECTAENDYGYADGTPCVLLKVNKVFGWQPTPFGNLSQVSHDDSDHVKNARERMGDRYRTDYIGISCEGENEGDADNVYGVRYFPNSGFSYKFYPYWNHKNYLPPLLFVKFNVRKGTLIQVWCKLWASNIKHHKNDKAGSSHFELMVD